MSYSGKTDTVSKSFNVFNKHDFQRLKDLLRCCNDSFHKGVHWMHKYQRKHIVFLRKIH